MNKKDSITRRDKIVAVRLNSMGVHKLSKMAEYSKKNQTEILREAIENLYEKYILEGKM